MKKMLGMSLIECMLSMTLSLVVLGAGASLYLVVEKNHAMQMAIKTIQDNSQFALDILQTAIRTAGYQGCAKRHDIPIQPSKTFFYGAKKDSDAFKVFSTSLVEASLIQTMQKQDQMEITSIHPFSKGEPFFITDCVTTDIGVIKTVTHLKQASQWIETERSLSHLFLKNSELHRLAYHHYYIADTGRKDFNGKPITALYKADQGHSIELVEGVNQMKMEYDVLENGAIKKYSSVDLTDASHVVGVSLQLQFFSVNTFPMEKKVHLYVALRER